MAQELLKHADFHYRIDLETRLGDEYQHDALRLLTRYSNDCADNGTKKVASLC